MARSTSARWWLAGACLAISAALIGAGPAIAGSSAVTSHAPPIAVTVVVEIAGPAVPLPGATPPDPITEPTGEYPAAPDPDGRRRAHRPADSPPPRG